MENLVLRRRIIFFAKEASNEYDTIKSNLFSRSFLQKGLGNILNP
jgi:hypothetical protein